MKPTIKTPLALSGVYPNTRTIFMDTTSDVILLAGLREFGVITDSAKYGWPNSYCLHVDNRYDFEEVVAYILEKYPQKLPDRWLLSKDKPKP